MKPLPLNVISVQSQVGLSMAAVPHGRRLAAAGPGTENQAGSSTLDAESHTKKLRVRLTDFPPSYA